MRPKQKLDLVCLLSSSVARFRERTDGLINQMDLSKLKGNALTPQSIPTYGT
jgi:hypothetical protein